MSQLQTVDDRRISVDEPDLFALLCERRGWDAEYLRNIESEDHDELLDMEAIVEVLHRARTQGQKVTIAPDFDMDGISSGVLGYAGLAELGFDVALHLPDYRRGHDLTPEDIDEIHQRYPDTQVLLTCDGGVNSHRGIAAARALGWTTLVTDHHMELPPGSTADVTIDPYRLDETYAHPGICGAHVLYQVLEAYTRVHAPEKSWEIRLLRLFAGLGTVSDVMPLLFENRHLVRDSVSLARLLRVAAPLTIPNRFGGFDPDADAIDIEQSTLIQLLRMDDHHPVFVRAFEGFALLLKAFAQHGKIRDIDDLDEGYYGFYLAPAMNSPRRIGVPIDECFTVFTAAGVDEKLAAAHTIIANNELRKEMVIDHLAELVDGNQPLAPWIYFSSAPGGMFGLLANQMMQLGGHPVAVVNRPTSPSDYVSGSGRAPEWFNIISSLEPYDGLAGVGHQQACGVRVQRAELLDTLVEVFRDATALAALHADTDGPRGDLVLGPGMDCDAGLEDLDPLFDLVRRVESLKPFGHGFVEPVYELALEPFGLRVERIGSSSECEHAQTGEYGFTNERGYWVCVACKKHLRLVTRSGLTVLWWNSADDKFAEFKKLVDNASHTATETLRFTAKLQLNTFRDITRIQAVVVEQLPNAD